jgi:hypothetical protein
MTRALCGWALVPDRGPHPEPCQSRNENAASGRSPFNRSNGLPHRFAGRASQCRAVPLRPRTNPPPRRDGRPTTSGYSPPARPPGRHAAASSAHSPATSTDAYTKCQCSLDNIGASVSSQPAIPRNAAKSCARDAPVMHGRCCRCQQCKRADRAPNDGMAPGLGCRLPRPKPTPLPPPPSPSDH